jgi:hypothetical protein
VGIPRPVGVRGVRPIGDGVGMDDEGSAESGRTRLARGTKPHALTSQCEHVGSAQTTENAPVQAGAELKGSGPVPASGAPGSADRAAAQSIHEAVEQLIEAQEADEAIAEWMQGGG